MPKKSSTKTTKKKPNAPLMAMKPGRGKPQDTPASRARRERIAVIRRRTSAALAASAKLAEGITFDEPAMIVTGPPRPKHSWRESDAENEDSDLGTPTRDESTTNSTSARPSAG